MPQHSTAPTIDPELLKLLRCPKTTQPLVVASPAQIALVNQRIAAGSCQDAGGEEVGDPISAGLVSQDQRWLYPIRDRIPTMIAEEAIELIASDPSD
jgi:uncharacterized protein YbaR (Trm112 family)